MRTAAALGTLGLGTAAYYGYRHFNPRVKKRASMKEVEKYLGIPEMESELGSLRG